MEIGLKPTAQAYVRPSLLKPMIVSPWLQGPDAIRAISVDRRSVKLQVPGMPNYEIRDYRPAVVQAVKHLVATGSLNVEHFHRAFFAPACMYPEGDKKFTLKPTRNGVPSHVLWVANGLTSSIPAYDFVAWNIVRSADDTFRILAVYSIED